MIKRIISNDDEALEEHVSAYELINHFYKYEPSLKKFNITQEELFEKLYMKKHEIDDYEEGKSSVTGEQY